MGDSVDLRDRAAAVTGGASGIGRAIAELLAERGARVTVGDIDYPEGVRSALAARGIEALDCDVTREPQVEALVEHAARGTGQLDIAIHSAGVGMVGPITERSGADWDHCLDVNVKGAYLLSRAAVPWMRRAGGGALVFIASNAGLLPRAHDPVYSTSKGALLALMRSVGLCHAGERIRCNAVCPGPVGQTRMMDEQLDAAPDRDAAVQALLAASPFAEACGRMITPREIAEAVLYLVSDAALFVTGTALAIDGGKSLGVPARRV
jgi:NAD(P)-dependent dehydrogenase (short-subunit alcohol dehydrogenase family)